MKTQLAESARFIGGKFNGFARRLKPLPNHSTEHFEAWFRDNGDATHRLNYDLCDNSIVIDAGGYKGEWSAEIFTRYCPTIYIFEPYAAFADKIQSRFCRNHHIHLYRKGLGDKSGYLGISVSGDSTSLHAKDNNLEKVEVIDVVEFFDVHQITCVDLLKINIEGGEYPLLERLIERNLIGKIKNIQVQFHDLCPESEIRMKAIQSEISKTHELTYQYHFVWENWQLKS